MINEPRLTKYEEDLQTMIMQTTRKKQDNDKLFEILKNAKEVSDARDAIKLIGQKKENVCVIRNVELKKYIKKRNNSLIYLCQFITNFKKDGVSSAIELCDNEENVFEKTCEIFIVNEYMKEKYHFSNFEDFTADVFIVNLQIENEFNLFNHVFKD